MRTAAKWTHIPAKNLPSPRPYQARSDRALCHARVVRPLGSFVEIFKSVATGEGYAGTAVPARYAIMNKSSSWLAFYP